ncbi:MAG: PBP1A family penicillin-binding protein [Syntrophomonadaceae bacterium]|jgi:1A family penicillin-binding protein|nr:PBP1A family penicillin-binding protein [Syntrophomonadaceae bacterium]
MSKAKYLMIVNLIIVLICCGFVIELPPVKVPEPSIIYDINGNVIRGITENNTINLNREEIPDHFINAIIAIEDKNFYSHYGFDPLGIVRAAFSNIKAGRIVAGGSTITQQTAKNLFLTNERTWLRKFKELLYAFQLEREYSKDEIITFYCNSIYFGHGAYGLEAAARTFFARSASELTLAQAALLAGITNWPSEYDPYINPDKAKNRQKIVLQRMVAEEMISSEEAELAANEKLNYESVLFVAGDAPYFSAMVTDYLVEKYGERTVYQEGMKIYTTLDLSMQRAANQSYADGMKDRPADLQAALVAVDPANGYIKALIGGRDYTKAPFNRVFADRQPGSTFKPFMYSLAVDWGITQADMFMCEEYEYKLITGDLYRPTDYGDKPFHNRRFTIREALAKSDNVIAVKVNEILGPDKAAEHANRFGFNDIKPILSLPLGSTEVKPVELAAAYSVFASGGVYSKTIYITEIKDRQGNVLEQNQIEQRRVLGEDTAYIITDMLKGVMQPGGTGSGLRNLFDRPVAGKTGTTDNFNDAWFVGFTPGLCCAVWVGYDADQTANLTGGAAAGPIWANFMRQATAGMSYQDFIRPANVVLINIDLDTGLIAAEGCERTSLMAFKKGTEPEELCYKHSSVWDWLFRNDMEENTKESVEDNNIMLPENHE